MMSHRNIDGGDVLGLRDSVRWSQRLSRVIDVLEREYADSDLSLSVAAQCCAVEKSHLNRLLRRATGWTFHQLLIRVRLARAAELLGGSNLSISRIAHEVGFGSLSTLERNFARHMGLQPRAYRRAARRAYRRRALAS